jgi:glucokinase
MKRTKKKLVIGVDIGGTHIRTGVVETSTRRVLGLTKSKTAELTLDVLCAGLERVSSEYPGKIGGIGVVVPGCCSADLRRSISTDGIVPFLDGCNLADIIEKRVGIPARVDNDVRAHTIGELRYGGWGEPRSLLVITLGTGVGLGWHVDGHLYPPPDHGAQGGHIAVSWTGGNPCYCGAQGCLDGLASGTAMEAAAAERLRRLLPSSLKGRVTAEQLCAAAPTDAMARGCIDRAIEALRAGLHTYHHILFPDLVVFGGGLARGLRPYLGELRKWFVATRRYDGRKNRLVLSRLGDKAAIYGAAALASGSYE